MIRVGVVGSGYVGSELVRWLLAHPRVELAAVTSQSRAGVPLTDAVPALLGYTDLRLTSFDPYALAELDAVLLATPHGATAPLVAALEDAGCPLILDLSADHRHAPGWAYGLAEFADLAGARRIAVPGCFATAIALALAPLATVLTGPVSIAAATGSTGSGAAPKPGTHHPERFANLKAYKVLEHQHVPEIRAFLASRGAAPHLRFVPLSAPVDRGIFATVFAPVGDVDAAGLFADTYAGHRLVRLRKETPELRFVRGTAFCDLAVHQDGEVAVVLSALDNLGKGAASQAVQCLNLALGLAPETGLLLPPATP